MSFFNEKKVNGPDHLAVIMDGNGRWAQKKGLPRSQGHVAGAKKFREIVLCCQKRNIATLTVYAFSTENWKRPKPEVNFLIKLFRSQLQEALDSFADENIRVVFLGDTSKFPENLRSIISKVTEISSNNTKMTLNVALNYGGRSEIINAAKNLATLCLETKIDVNEINEEKFSSFLYTKGQKDPDLIIRTGIELRLSNFLLWQSAYSELFFPKILWPDFSESDLDKILEEYSGRKRRYGGILA